MNHRNLPLMIVAVVLVCGLIQFQEVQSRPDGTPLSVMTFNVGTFNGEPANINRIESIARNPEVPDILILQEVHGEESCRYLSGSLGLPFWVFSFYPAGIGDGLAVISRYPVKILKSFRFNRYGALAVEAVVDSEKMLICSVHLERIKGMTTGPKVARFEKDFAEYVGARYALAVCIWPWRRRVSVPAIW